MVTPEFGCAMLSKRRTGNAEHADHDCAKCRKLLPYNVPGWCTDENCSKGISCGFERK